MLAAIDAGLIVQVLAIAVPLLVGFGVWMWNLHVRQDTKLAKNVEQTTRLEERTANHTDLLKKGDERFDTVVSDIGGLKTDMATTRQAVTGVQASVQGMDKKIDTLLAKG